jgi:hypothetical protein
VNRVAHRLFRYSILSTCLQLCGNLKSAYEFCSRAVKKYPSDTKLSNLRTNIASISSMLMKKPNANPEDFTDNGRVRREIYPWSNFEPDRTSQETVSHLNAILKEVAPKMEVKLVKLPFLRPDGQQAGPNSTVTQLGLFAKEDLAPSQVVMDELSLITSCGRLNDAYCDACSASLPSGSPDTQSCTECDDEVVFCSAKCQALAQEQYHPAVCGVDVSSIAKDVPITEATTALYTLLLFRTFAMSITQNTHPLALSSIKYIWGDFNPPPTHPSMQPKFTLAFTFQYNILLPLNFLEKALDNSAPNEDGSIPNIFTCRWAHVWVFNTLLSKFRGTASAKQGPDGRPEVGAVHPMWCLANHSCDPNVTWEWDGSIKFSVVAKRANWKGKGVVRQAGLGKGEELLSHYCDTELGVKDRRGWAKGALGGVCCCERCVWEAGLS